MRHSTKAPKDQIKEHAKAIEDIMSCNMYSDEFQSRVSELSKSKIIGFNLWSGSRLEILDLPIGNENPPTNQSSVPYSRTVLSYV